MAKYYLDFTATPGGGNDGTQGNPWASFSEVGQNQSLVYGTDVVQIVSDVLFSADQSIQSGLTYVGNKPVLDFASLYKINLSGGDNTQPTTFEGLQMPNLQKSGSSLIQLANSTALVSFIGCKCKNARGGTFIDETNNNLTATLQLALIGCEFDFESLGGYSGQDGFLRNWGPDGLTVLSCTFGRTGSTSGWIGNGSGYDGGSNNTIQDTIFINRGPTTNLSNMFRNAASYPNCWYAGDITPNVAGVNELTGIIDIDNNNFDLVPNSSAITSGGSGIVQGQEPIGSDIRYFDSNLTTGANDGSSLANAWQTISAMVSGVAAGDTVYVADGEHSGGSIAFTVPVSIRALNRGKATLRSNNPASNILISMIAGSGVSAGIEDLILIDFAQATSANGGSFFFFISTGNSFGNISFQRNRVESKNMSSSQKCEFRVRNDGDGYGLVNFIGNEFNTSNESTTVIDNLNIATSGAAASPNILSNAFYVKNNFASTPRAFASTLPVGALVANNLLVVESSSGASASLTSDWAVNGNLSLNSNQQNLTSNPFIDAENSNLDVLPNSNAIESGAGSRASDVVLWASPDVANGAGTGTKADPYSIGDAMSNSVAGDKIGIPNGVYTGLDTKEPWRIDRHWIAEEIGGVEMQGNNWDLRTGTSTRIDGFKTTANLGSATLSQILLRDSNNAFIDNHIFEDDNAITGGSSRGLVASVASATPTVLFRGCSYNIFASGAGNYALFHGNTAAIASAIWESCSFYFRGTGGIIVTAQGGATVKIMRKCIMDLGNVDQSWNIASTGVNVEDSIYFNRASAGFISDTNNQEANPLFIDAENNNFKLLPASPAIALGAA